MSVEEIGARLSLKDRRKFSSDAKGAADDVENIGDKIDAVDRKASGLKSTLGGLSSGLKTVGGLAFKAGAMAGGVAAAGIGAFAAMGVQAYSAAEQAEISFTTMLGSGKEARAFLGELEQFAATTPFEMQGLTNSAQGLLAFGFQAKEVLPMMTAIGDASAGLGAGEEGMDRMVRAMGQIQAKGKASAEDLMQLAELGVPVWDMLAKKLGTDVPTAMEQVSKGQVDAATTIDALLTGMNDQFGGLMEKQSQSVSGLWSTLQDNIRMTAKKAVEPFADDLRRGLRRGIGYAENLGAWFTDKFPGYVAQARDQIPNLWEALKTGDTSGLVGPAKEVVDVVNDIVTVFRDLLIPTLSDAAGVLPSFTSPLGIARNLLGFLADNAETLQPWLTGLVATWLAWRGAMLLWNTVAAIGTGITTARTAVTFLFAGAKGAATVATVAETGVTVTNTAAHKAGRAGLILHTAATWASRAASLAVRGALLVWAGAQWALNAAMSMNPIGLVVLAIVALVAIFVIAWKKSETFRNIVTGAFDAVKGAAVFVWNWIKGHWPLLLAILTGPFGLAVLAIVKNWDKIKAGAAAVKDWVVEKFTALVGWFKSLPGKISSAASTMWNGIKDSFRGVINWVIDAWNSVDFAINVHIPDWVPGIGGKGWSSGDIVPDIPRLHTGGRTTSGGAAIIQPDEELVVLPPAASVIPTPEGGIPSTVFGGGQGDRPIVVPVYIDRKKVAEAVYDNTRDEAARL